MSLSNLLLVVLLFVLALFSCKEKGCTDPAASNFKYEAVEDDGSCEYRGCTDPRAINYDPDAFDDDGSCRYTGTVNFYSDHYLLEEWNTYMDVAVQEGYIGSIEDRAPDEVLSCDEPTSHIRLADWPEGPFIYSYWIIRRESQYVFDTIDSGSGSAYVYENECTPVTI
ncbi:MAG TPA: hypothetical protein DDX92_10960 [Flavobacteriales bacterium]|jgi:hypothetical protein|nr:hypothetical protein [Flavobacteriales bacterium]